jgi:hypothetical protein
MPLKFVTNKVEATTDPATIGATTTNLTETPTTAKFVPEAVTDYTGSGAASGFSLKFTDGLTYDLDEILFNIRRDNPDSPLAIQVFAADSEQEVILSLSVRQLLEEYSPTTVFSSTISSGSTVVSLDSGFDTSLMLQGLVLSKTSGAGSFGSGARVSSVDGASAFTATVAHSASGTIYFRAALDNVNLIPNFTQLLAERYQQNLELNSLEEEQGASAEEGSISINEAQPKIKVTKADMLKYLTTPASATQRQKPIVNLNRPLVTWTEGQGDLNVPGDFAAFDNLANIIADYESNDGGSFAEEELDGGLFTEETTEEENGGAF